MPASAASILAGSKASFSHQKTMLGWVKVFSPSTTVHSGVTCKIYKDEADNDYAVKAAAIPLALARVTGAGFTFPNGIKFYCTSQGAALSIAFHRDFTGTREATVILGPASVSFGNPGMYPGIAHTVTPLNKANYAEAVIVHELGHNLHERANEGLFWDGPVAMGTEPLANLVSQYATKNVLEYVAEVFTGRIYGRNYGVNVMTAYAGYGGPTTPAFP